MKRNDPKSPNIVLAPSPNDRGKIIKLLCNPETVRHQTGDDLREKLGEYCGLVHGNLIEDSKEGYENSGTSGLLDSVALFQGLKRPLRACSNDEDVYIYITNPTNSYTYQYRSIGPCVTAKPKDSVFGIYVEMGTDFSMFSATENMKLLQQKVCGKVLFWEWLISSDNKMPNGYELRYAKRVW